MAMTNYGPVSPTLKVTWDTHECALTGKVVGVNRRLHKLAPFIRPNLPDTGDLIRQHGVQDQALAMKK